MELILIILIAICASVSAILSNNKKLFDNRYKGTKKVTNRGYLIIFLNFGIILFSAIQFFYTDFQNKQKEKDLRKDYTQSVNDIIHYVNSNGSLLKQTYDTSVIALKEKYDASTSNIIIALARFGLSYDSSKKIIESIAQKADGLNPELELKSGNEISYDSLYKRWEIYFYSRNASTTNYEISVNALAEDRQDKLTNVGYIDPLREQKAISRNEGLLFIFYSKNVNDNLVKHFYIQIKGSYTNIDGTKSFNIDKIYMFDKQQKKTVELAGKAKQKAELYFKVGPKPN